MFLSPRRPQGEGVPVPAPHLPAAEQYLQGGWLHRGGSDTDDDLSAAHLRCVCAAEVTPQTVQALRGMVSRGMVRCAPWGVAHHCEMEHVQITWWGRGLHISTHGSSWGGGHEGTRKKGGRGGCGAPDHLGEGN